jgi:hypothetical protein
MHGMWFLNAAHSVAESSGDNCSSRVIEYFEEALSVLVPNNQPSVSSNRLRMFFNRAASLVPVSCLFTYDTELAFATAKAQAINIIESDLYLMQCPIWIHIVSNDRGYGECVS